MICCRLLAGKTTAGHKTLLTAFGVLVFLTGSVIVDATSVARAGEPLEISLTGARLRTKSAGAASPGGKLGPAANPPAAGGQIATSSGPKPSPRIEQKHSDNHHYTTMLKMSAAYVEAPQYFRPSLPSNRADMLLTKRKPFHVHVSNFLKFILLTRFSKTFVAFHCISLASATGKFKQKCK